MAGFTIEKRKIASGELRYKCIVREKANGTIIHNESKTFTQKALSERWGRKRVLLVQEGRLTEKQKTVTLFELLNLFIEDHELWGKTGRTKRYVIQMLSDCDISTFHLQGLHQAP